MASAQTAPRAERPAFECRVRFSGRLVGAEIARAIEPSPGPPPRTPAAEASGATPAKPQAPPSKPQVPPPLAAAVAPVDFWKTELAREQQADRARIETVLGQLRTAAAEFQRDQPERLGQWQRAAVELAMTMSTRLLHERIISGDFPMEAKVRDMVKQLEGEPPVAVRLNPEDLQLLAKRLGDEPLLAGMDDLKLIPDASLARGECRVEGKEAMLLSDVGRELQEIRDELLRSLAHARS